mmetsp:Transcript_3240/g.6980  ORF Transcript_3240/g.6980 Transcript_3240/m.6980 type:complete len:543 (-) Transcript_3240:673-2301(-)
MGGMDVRGHRAPPADPLCPAGNRQQPQAVHGGIPNRRGHLQHPADIPPAPEAQRRLSPAQGEAHGQVLRAAHRIVLGVGKLSLPRLCLVQVLRAVQGVQQEHGRGRQGPAGQRGPAGRPVHPQSADQERRRSVVVAVSRQRQPVRRLGHEGKDGTHGDPAGLCHQQPHPGIAPGGDQQPGALQAGSRVPPAALLFAGTGFRSPRSGRNGQAVAGANHLPAGLHRGSGRRAGPVHPAPPERLAAEAAVEPQLGLLHRQDPVPQGPRRRAGNDLRERRKGDRSLHADPQGTRGPHRPPVRVPALRRHPDGIGRHEVPADRPGAATGKRLRGPLPRGFGKQGLGPRRHLPGRPGGPCLRAHPAHRAQGPHRGAQGGGRAQGPGEGPPGAAAGRGRGSRPQDRGREADPAGTGPPGGRKEEEDPARNGKHQEGAAPAGDGTQHGLHDHRGGFADGHREAPEGAPGQDPQEEGGRRAQDEGIREAPGLPGPCHPHRRTSVDPKAVRREGQDRPRTIRERKRRKSQTRQRTMGVRHQGQGKPYRPQGL